MPRPRRLPRELDPGDECWVRIFDPKTGECYMRDVNRSSASGTGESQPTEPTAFPPSTTANVCEDVDYDDQDFGFWNEPTSLASHQAAPIVWVCQDGSEGHVLIPDCAIDQQPSQQQSRQQHFGFGTLRFVEFADRTVLVGWCSTPACPNKTHLGRILEGKHYHSVQSSDFLKEEACICNCLQQFVDEIGGEHALRQLYEQHVAKEPPFHISYTFKNKQYHIVQLGNSYNSLGLIRPLGKRLLCYTCPNNKQHCGHMQHLRGESSTSEEHTPWLDDSQFEDVFRKVFDTAKGQGKTFCISQKQLPVDLKDEPELLEIYLGRAPHARPLPAVCAPDVANPCLICSQTEWSSPHIPQSQPTTRVFFPATTTETQFAELHCLTIGCHGVLKVDGKEFGLLRYSDKYAFSHELLYNWGDETSTGGVPWYSYWRNTLHRYKDCDLPQLREWMFTVEAKFQQACLDWIQLQCIDWDSAFNCNHGAKNLIVDALTIGYRLKHAHIVHPWHEWRSEGEVSLVWGSSFQGRIFVRSGNLRTQLLQLCLRDDKHAMTTAEHSSLLSQLHTATLSCEQEGLLFPFVETVEQLPAGKVTVLEPYRNMLFCLATEAPVAQLLKPHAAALVQKLLDGNILTVIEQQELEHRCPILFDFLKPSFGNDLPGAVEQLLTAMLRVMDGAFVPQSHRAPFTVHAMQPASRAHAAFQQATGRSAQPESWSQEEAFLRTGAWGGSGSGATWQPSSLGGSNVLRSLPAYGMDHVSRRGERRSCTKYKDQNKNLLPGVILFWCRICWLCNFFQIMPNAESPATVFEALYTRWDEAPEELCYDNNCNEHDYCLNREPAFFKHTEFAIDSSHFRGHKDCSLAYDSKRYARYTNSPLAEEKNKLLRQLEGHLVNMKQTTFLWYLRYFLFRLNKLQRDKNEGNCFFVRASKR